MAVVWMPCSGCQTEVRLDIDNLAARVTIPSNGRRGSLHVPAHLVSSDVVETDCLLEWECPACGYADSYEVGVED